jgi:Urease accessory protein UreH
MTADGCASLAAESLAAPREGWRGQLQLQFVARAGRTVLARGAHQGPLRVQRLLYPESPDTAQVILLHPPGGLVHGDRLHHDLRLESGARVQFTTPGASKFYGGGTRVARSEVCLQVAARAGAEWFPQETIVFDGALGGASLDVDLETGGSFGGWEILCFGRPAAGERFEHGHWHQRLCVRVDGRLTWFEQAVLQGGDARFRDPAALDGHAVSGTFLVAGLGDAELPMTELQATTAEAPAQFGVTVLPELLVGRYLGDSAEAARHYFSALWTLLRPRLCGRAFVPPRIWST